jgi:molybdate transport system substrate-binding protein
MPRARLLRALAAGLLALLAACAPAPTNAVSGELTILAAASLTDAFTVLGAEFEARQPGARVSFSFAGSNQLAQQIAAGAPADVFASANARQMQVAVDSGRIAAAAPQTFARNRLVVIFPGDNPGRLAALTDLAQPGLRLVLAAAEVPVGQYSLDFLAKAAQDPAFPSGYQAAVLANIVSYEENVRAVFTKVALGEADAGLVYTSDVVGEGAESLGRLEIPDTLNTIAEYPIAPLADSAHPALAQAFIDLVLSAEGQAVLAEYGFEPAP